MPAAADDPCKLGRESWPRARNRKLDPSEFESVGKADAMLADADLRLF